MQVPDNFQLTAPAYKLGDPMQSQPHFTENPQTVTFIMRFGLREDFRSQKFGGSRIPSYEVTTPNSSSLFVPMDTEAIADEEIDLGDD